MGYDVTCLYLGHRGGESVTQGGDRQVELSLVVALSVELLAHLLRPLAAHLQTTMSSYISVNVGWVSLVLLA